MTRMKRITWFRGHLQSSRDKPFRHSEISASTLHYRVTPFSFSSMGATISTLVWMLTSLLTSYLRQDPSISPVLLRVILSVQLQSAWGCGLRWISLVLGFQYFGWNLDPVILCIICVKHNDPRRLNLLLNTTFSNREGVLVSSGPSTALRTFPRSGKVWIICLNNRVN